MGQRLPREVLSLKGLCCFFKMREVIVYLCADRNAPVESDNLVSERTADVRSLSR